MRCEVIGGTSAGTTLPIIAGARRGTEDPGDAAGARSAAPLSKTEPPPVAGMPHHPLAIQTKKEEKKGKKFALRRPLPPAAPRWCVVSRWACIIIPATRACVVKRCSDAA